jgi:hypothetical protein
MCAEQTKQATDSIGNTPDLFRPSGRCLWMEQKADVAVAEAGRGELAASDGREECDVVRVTGAQSPDALSPVRRRLGDGVQERGERGRVVDDRERVEVSLVGGLGDLGASVEVGDALAQR